MAVLWRSCFIYYRVFRFSELSMTHINGEEVQLQASRLAGAATTAEQGARRQATDNCELRTAPKADSAIGLAYRVTRHG